MATAVYDGVARARRAGARRALHPLGGGWAGARARYDCCCADSARARHTPPVLTRSATLWLLLCCYRVLTTRVHVLM